MFILYKDVDSGADTGHGTSKLETRLFISEKSVIPVDGESTAASVAPLSKKMLLALLFLCFVR